MRGLLILLMLFLTLWIYHPILYTLVYQKWFFFNLVEKDMFHHHLNS